MATGSGFGWDSKDGATSHRRVLLKRRGFLKRSLSAVVGSGAFVSSSGVEGRAHGKNAATPLNGPIRFAQIGVGGQGAIDLQGVIAAGGTPAAFCDVDVQRAGKTYEAHPHVPRFTDYRVMLDRMSNEIDGVVISTPVHQHGAQAVDAIRRGLHVFVQTPMVRTIEELDAVSAAARKHGVVTQVGINLNQLSPSKSWAKPELGTIRRVQAWTDRPNWPQGMDSIPKPTTPPVSLDWDLWLGPSAKRPFAKGYLPGAWRAWCDFGCGAIGDVFPHHVQDLFRDAGLGVPTELVAKSCSGADVSFPLWSEITFQLNSSDDDGLPISLVWYDGNRRPESGSLSASGPLEEPSDPVAVRKTDADEVPVVAADTSPESSGGSGSGAPQLIDRPISVRRNGCAVIGSRLTLAGEGFGQVPR
ncbi:MAG: Gfo/Idh/MocA family oxidoreductase, partial [Planctomycetota bacterium]